MLAQEVKFSPRDILVCGSSYCFWLLVGWFWTWLFLGASSFNALLLLVCLAIFFGLSAIPAAFLGLFLRRWTEQRKREETSNSENAALCESHRANEKSKKKLVAELSKIGFTLGMIGATARAFYTNFFGGAF
ncbi:hypothetical protein shim_00410 [Shimia sp. SK013]|uniref:hypothetical protein n=1 Tax=Shimia sp. SK013 TaxID=1389006 RepID=UPI0006B4DFB0|nr:hypothetical protein [Shimia sp. SK013]KPA23714.1 hypothetical protein shim_00410 [Shimia sp. SK013]